MRLLGNIIWLIFGGLISALVYFIVGILLCLTIIGIPFGLQCFKMAKLVLSPFGKEVSLDFNKHPVANILWAIFIGWETALGFLFVGVLFCITIIGVPFGKQMFKLATLTLIPFGSEIE